MQLSIIIVNYNVKYFVEQCLLSIYKNEGFAPGALEVFVVDNASTDGSVAYLTEQFPAERYPHLHLIANRRNVGFGKANNLALRQSRGEYVLFLNPDTLLTEHTLRDVLAFAREHADLGALGVRMLHTNGRFALESRRGLPTPWVSFCRLSGLTTLFPRSRRFGRYYMQYLPIDRPAPIEINSGAFMLLRREAALETKGFDETFFMYGEDIDLSFRLLKLGYQNYYHPTPILHYKGESTKKNTYRYVHVFYQAMLLFFNKHYRHYGWLFSVPIQVAILLRALLALLTRQYRFVKRFLHPRRQRPSGFMLYLGTSGEKVERLATAYGLDIDCREATAETLPQGHLSAGIDYVRYQHVVYDTADFPFALQLQLFSEQKSKNVHIGTFNPERGILITGSNTFTLFSNHD